MQLQSNWTGGVKFNDNYDDYKDELIDMLSEIKDMWDGPHGPIITVNPNRPHIALGSTLTLALYRTQSHAPEIQRDEIDKRVKTPVIEPAQTDWAAPILCAPKKDAALRSSVDYWDLNAVTFRTLTVFQGLMNRSTYLEILDYFRHQTRIQDTSKSK